MKRAGSLQKRLSVGLAIGVTIMWVFATIGTGLVVRHELDEAFDSALQETAQRLLPLAVTDIIDHEDSAVVRTVAALSEHEEFLTYLVRDASGNILLQSHDADPRFFPSKPSRGFHETPTHRLYGEAAVSNTIFIEVAEPLAHRRAATLESIAALFIPLLIFVPASLIGVWVFVRRSMHPVISFKEEIASRSGSNLSPVTARAIPDEIEPIADAVNTLLDRLRRTLEAERSFTANSAHELRTPIAAALAQTQRLIAEMEEGPMQARAGKIEKSLRDLTHLAEKLLQLAKAEGGGLMVEKPQNLLPILEHLLEEFRSRSECEELLLDRPDNIPLMSNMDPDAFGILMRNLIENALKYGDAGVPIKITVSGGRRLSIVNSCPVLFPSVLKQIKGRFERGSTSVSGFGLGLAIAEAVITGAGGKMQFLSPATKRDNGFEVIVELPGTTLF